MTIMKRYIYTAIAAVAAVAAGCAKSDVVELPQASQTPISFETYTGKTPVTKASSVTTAVFEESTETAPAFNVKAFVPSTGTEIITHMDEDVWCSQKTVPATEGTEGTPAVWDYDGKTYWPSDGKLTFVAYGLNAEDNITNPTATEFTYTVPANASAQSDLVVAACQTTTAMPTGGKMSLVFDHVLSRVGFTLETTTESVNVRVKSVKLIGSFYNSCSVDLTQADPAISEPTGSVTEYYLFDTRYGVAGATGPFDCFYVTNVPTIGVGIYPNYTLTPSTEDGVSDTYAEKDQSSADDRFMMLIPGGTVTGAEVIYEIQGATEQHVQATLDGSITLVAGTAYEFIIRLSTDMIQFEGKVVEWATAEEINIPKPEPEPEDQTPAEGE